LRRQSEYNADKGKGYDSICQGRKKRMVSKQRIWSQHTTTREERQPFGFEKRGREEERKQARQQDNKEMIGSVKGEKNGE
jgi:hypothetical protein